MAQLRRVERHLYKYTHVDVNGRKSLRWYALFTDHTGEPRKFKLGDGSKQEARDALGELRKLDRAGYDFDSEAREAAARAEAEAKEEADKVRRGLTLKDWIERYFAELVYPKTEEHNAPIWTWKGLSDDDPKKPNTIKGERIRAEHLVNQVIELDNGKKVPFGDLPLCDILSDAMLRYRQARLTATAKGKKTTMKGVSVNRELAFLGYLLNQAAAKEDENRKRYLEAVPKIPKLKEGGARTDSVTPEQYGAILGSASREIQRVVTCWYETAMRHAEVFHLTWPMIDLKVQLVRMPANICKERVPRRVPISYELRQVLLELKELRLKTGTRNDYVFIRDNGAPIVDITKGFTKALERADLADSKITPHSFRRACITRWTDLGITSDIVKRACGHTDKSIHGDYLIFTDEMMVKPFREKGLFAAPSERKQAVAS